MSGVGGRKRGCVVQMNGVVDGHHGSVFGSKQLGVFGHVEG